MFFVIDETEIGVSWSAKTESGESFKTERAAIKRAEDLAECEPGKAFIVAKAIKAVRCSVGGPLVKDLA